MDEADLIVINTCAIREGAEQKVIGRQGQLARLKDAQSRAAGRADRLFRSRTGSSRPAPALPGGGPLPPPGRGARARRPAGPGLGPGADRRERRDDDVGRTVVGVADHLAGTRAAAVGQGSVARESPVSAWLPIIYGCDKTCTYCIVPFSRGPERSRPFDDIVAEAAPARRRGLPGGHPAGPERQFVRA